MILEVDNVELNYSGKRILNGIYLKAETGKVLGVLGLNGSGKSSLLQVIFGSLKPKYKLIRINKKPQVTALYKSGSTKLLPQFSFISGGFKVIKAFKMYKVDWDDFISEYTAFGRYKFTRMKRLSGGERRLIEIYLSLKTRGKIVLLDEPFTHLAPIYVENIKALINIEKQHKIIIMTDHMYRQIMEISDSIYLLKNGNTVEVNGAEDLEEHRYINR